MRRPGPRGPFGSVARVVNGTRLACLFRDGACRSSCAAPCRNTPTMRIRRRSPRALEVRNAKRRARGKSRHIPNLVLSDRHLGQLCEAFRIVFFDRRSEEMRSANLGVREATACAEGRRTVPSKSCVVLPWSGLRHACVQRGRRRRHRLPPKRRCKSRDYGGRYLGTSRGHTLPARWWMTAVWQT